jgi:hypothetical protein
MSRRSRGFHDINGFYNNFAIFTGKIERLSIFFKTLFVIFGVFLSMLFELLTVTLISTDV